MHYYGGVYADLDFESIRPMDKYLKGKQLVLGRMGDNAFIDHSIPNAFMASIPGHPFWIKVLDHIKERMDGRTKVEEVLLQYLTLLGNRASCIV
jgi:mannosyltransferase OCH1-like enzyme